MKHLNLEEMVSMVEKLCKKGEAYRQKRMRAGEKSSAYLSGRAVKVCKGQMQGENTDPDGDDITIDPDTNFKVDLKHLIQKHIVDDGEDLDEIEMSIQEVLGMDVIDENITEAKYKGKTVQLNKPMRGDVKKFKVYVNSGKKNADGSIKVKKVNFGHGGTSAKRPTMRIRKSNPKRRKAFRARHRCSSPGPKTMARYWSCKKW
jgi:hypothetical protein